MSKNILNNEEHQKQHDLDHNQSSLQSNQSQDSFDDPQKLVIGNWKIVDLPIIDTPPGWNQQQILLRISAKVQRFRNQQWKERGQGDLKLIRNHISNKIRLIGHASKTLRIFINHFVNQIDNFCYLTKSLFKQHTWQWQANDFSDGITIPQKFTAQFNDLQSYLLFQCEFNKAAEHNKLVLQDKQ